MISVGHTKVKSYDKAAAERVSLALQQYCVPAQGASPARLRVEQEHSPLLRVQSLAHAHGLDFAVDDGCGR